jgi:hypothetical protein
MVALEGIVEVNSSNFVKMKLIKILNNLGVAHIILNISLIPTLESIDSPTSSYNSLTLKKSNELIITIVTI